MYLITVTNDPIKGPSVSTGSPNAVIQRQVRFLCILFPCLHTPSDILQRRLDPLPASNNAQLFCGSAPIRHKRSDGVSNGGKRVGLWIRLSQQFRHETSHLGELVLPDNSILVPISCRARSHKQCRFRTEDLMAKHQVFVDDLVGIDVVNMVHECKVLEDTIIIQFRSAKPHNIGAVSFLYVVRSNGEYIDVINGEPTHLLTTRHRTEPDNHHHFAQEDIGTTVVIHTQKGYVIVPSE